MIDAIDLLNIPFTLQKISRKEAITPRERQVLLDYLEEFPLGLHSQEVKAKVGDAVLSEPEPLPTPEELEAILESVDEQEKKEKEGKRRRKK